MAAGLCVWAGGGAVGAGGEEAPTLKAAVELLPAPVSPLRIPTCDQSILLGRSAHQVSRTTELRYDPIEEGGFTITGGARTFNRTISIGRNNVATGDLPIFRVFTTTGSGVYAADRSFPLFPRDDAIASKAAPALGTLRIGVAGVRGEVDWLHEQKGTVARFFPGYTRYSVRGPQDAWRADVVMAPAVEHHGFVCRVEFDRPVTLEWSFGAIHWDAKESGENRVELKGDHALVTEAGLPGGAVYVGCDAAGQFRTETGKHGESAVFRSSQGARCHHLVGVWGVTHYDEDTASAMMSRLDTSAASAWQDSRDAMKRSWFDCYIGRALNPQRKFLTALREPEKVLIRSISYWDERRSRFQIKTPDPYLNALVNFERCISEYHQMGPGMVLSTFKWLMYSHISVGWYGRMWAGDLEEVKTHMRFLGAMQGDDGFINWISPSLHAYRAENNTPYWVDHIWRLYEWTGDERLVRDLWPGIEKAAEWECRNNDPDGDGLFQSAYEYWNCDSNGKGPKAAAPTSTAWALLDRAARMARVVGDREAGKRYQSMAEKVKEQAFEELWNEEQGILGSIGAEGLWRGHPQTWEQYLGIINGMIPADKGQRAMRWLESHYGFEGEQGVQLLMNCDWWPLRWSVHWVPTGDTHLAALAGMVCGDPDLWWPYLKTAVLSSFRSDAPGVRFSIGNTSGGGGGGIEFVDSDDPLVYTTVRGLFGIEPEIQNGRIRITPAFPADWDSAEIHSPMLSYSYTRERGRVTLKITTPEPLVKVVRSQLGVPAITTARERVSVVTLQLPSREEGRPAQAFPDPILVETAPALKETPLGAEEKSRLVMMDLSAVHNTTLHDLVDKIRFKTDFGRPTTIHSWWHTVPARMNRGPEQIETPAGVAFLLKGRNESVEGKAKNLLALSSWGKPYPLPAVARIPLGKKVERMWLLMQNYVSPIKNYIPNGEIVLHYASGQPDIVSLVPPYNLDCYFQAFSRDGVSVELGELVWAKGWSPCHRSQCKAQANALKVACDPSRVLKTVEIRATVSEGVLGINAITLLPCNGL